MITVITVIMTCAMCYHGQFRPGSGAWFSALRRSTATTRGHDGTTKLDAMAIVSERIRVIDGSGCGQSGEIRAHHHGSPTKDYQPSDSKLMATPVPNRRLGLMIPLGKGQAPYFLVCIGTAGLVAAVHGGNFRQEKIAYRI